MALHWDQITWLLCLQRRRTKINLQISGSKYFALDLCFSPINDILNRICQFYFSMEFNGEWILIQWHSKLSKKLALRFDCYLKKISHPLWYTILSNVSHSITRTSHVFVHVFCERSLLSNWLLFICSYFARKTTY